MCKKSGLIATNLCVFALVATALIYIVGKPYRRKARIEKGARSVA